MAARSAYIHVPFCRHRCGYCDFTVVADRQDLETSYLKAIELELQSLADPQPVETLFVGGGTPTELSIDGLKQLLALLKHWFPLESSGEFTFEANPDGLNEERVRMLAGAGVNRLSLGVQSFSNAKLQRLDRKHTVAETTHALEIAMPHFQKLSIDLIFAAPGETLEDWRQDLAAAVRWKTDHLSTYGLTFEKGTNFWNQRQHGTLTETDDELQRDMYLMAIDHLTEQGYEQYEVSSFARAGHRCRHNEVYWTGKPYFAIGPGASRFIDNTRSTNHRSTTTYINRVLAGESPVAESEQLDAETLARERLVFGLRRLEGIAMAEFASETGFEIDDLVGSKLPQLIEHGLLQTDNGHLRLTRDGLLVSDSIWPQLL